MESVCVMTTIFQGRPLCGVEQRGFELQTSQLCIRECLAFGKEFEAQGVVSGTSAGKLANAANRTSIDLVRGSSNPGREGQWRSPGRLSDAP